MKSYLSKNIEAKDFSIDTERANELLYVQQHIQQTIILIEEIDSIAKDFGFAEIIGNNLLPLVDHFREVSELVATEYDDTLDYAKAEQGQKLRQS